MRTLLLAVLAAAVVLSACARPGFRLETESDVAQAIQGGALGEELAARAVKTGELWLREQEDTGIPYRTFCYSDYRAGYTVLLEGDRLVLLCSGLGGGCAGAYRLRRIWRLGLLTYEFQVGSGISRTKHGRYVLGTGVATWDRWQ